MGLRRWEHSNSSGLYRRSQALKHPNSPMANPELIRVNPEGNTLNTETKVTEWCFDSRVQAGRYSHRPC
jgi:hypothetical protein